MAVYTGKTRWTANPFELLTDALTDPKRQHAAFVAALVLYVLVWTIYGVIAKGGQDIHFAGIPRMTADLS
jgi:hypothetical protein